MIAKTVIRQNNSSHGGTETRIIYFMIIKTISYKFSRELKKTVFGLFKRLS